MLHRSLRLAAVLGAAVASLTLPRTASAKPPWISIEVPVNPWDRVTKDAFLVVHVFHFNRPDASEVVDGTAEGLVDGRRQSVKLDFGDGSEPASYVLRRTWPATGTWTLVIRAHLPGDTLSATAIVELAPGGDVASIRVPTREENGWTHPVSVAMSDIDASLRARAGVAKR